ncbi:MAG: Spy/CpxP family protein refolding chaperone [Thermodesulfobacteriota bacterium]
MKRKMLTKGIPVMLMLALVLSLSTAAWAKGFGRGPMNLTPEQAGQMFDLKEKFMQDTAELRKAMWIKKAELRTLWRAENPDAKAIQAKQKEMNALREQLQAKMVDFRIQARKICPQLGKGMGRGMGMGHGMGKGMGRGMAMAGGGPGMGMGPGCGW